MSWIAAHGRPNSPVVEWASSTIVRSNPKPPAESSLFLARLTGRRRLGTLRGPLGIGVVGEPGQREQLDFLLLRAEMLPAAVLIGHSHGTGAGSV
ncbi:hypothetical protein GCM10010253_63600 [Streptomyces badius]|uniref:Uncharacterized protein n=1 Tax=Streptomyces badius TaxID=1941 RepID=A0ABQ2TPY7_STRBA|nr:hypothetical protein GCM10010253_63600 [Streptomyces badius]